MGKTISLRGKAAKAFLETQVKHTKPATEDEKYEQVATIIHMHVKIDDLRGAVVILKLLRTNGIDTTHDCVMKPSADLGKKPCRSGSRKSST